MISPIFGYAHWNQILSHFPALSQWEFQDPKMEKAID